MLEKSLRYGLLTCAWLFAGPTFAFDMAAAMAVGGWQEREEVTLNERGKVTQINVIWVGVVGEEERGGVPHVWLEMRSQEQGENRKGERRPKGDLMIMKSLVEKSVLADIQNPAAQLQKFGKEIIMQAGNDDPIRMPAGGMMAGMVAQGMDIDFSFDDTGEVADISVPAGEIEARKFVGTGSAQMKVLVRTMNVESTVESWLSEDVPMGVVKQTTTSVTNGKTSTMTGVLLDYGNGATSMIDDARVQDMPNLFGN